MSLKEGSKEKNVYDVSDSADNSVEFQSNGEKAVKNEILRLNKKKKSLHDKLSSPQIFLEQVQRIQIDQVTLVEVELRVNTLQDNLTASFSETNDFENIYYSTLAEAKQMLSVREQLPRISTAMFQGQDHKVKRFNARLPVIEVPKFAGSSKDWLEFQDLFISLIHNSNDIYIIDKYHYLKTSLEDAAARCISSIEFCASNYFIAWDTLCVRFENKPLLVHNYIKSLFNIKSISSDSPTAFRDLLDTRRNLKCLQVLGIDTNSWDPVIIYLVTTKMDATTVKEWEMQTFQHELPSLDELKVFLRNQEDILEKIQMHKSEKSRYFNQNAHQSKKLNTKSFLSVSDISDERSARP